MRPSFACAMAALLLALPAPAEEEAAVASVPSPSDETCTPCEDLEETRRKLGRWQKECDEKSAEACAAIAHSYWGPPYCCLPERPPDHVTTLLLLNRSCALGHETSCRDLFDLTAYAEKSDDIRSIHRACEAGVAAACHSHAEYLARASPDKSDRPGVAFPERLRDRLARAAPYHRRACELGHLGACAQHAVNLSEGIGQAEDPAAGFALLRETCAAHRGTPQKWFDGALACVWLGDALWRGTGVAQQKNRARRAWHEACRIDDLGCDRLPFMGQVLQQPGVWVVWALEGGALVFANALSVFGLIRRPSLSPRTWRVLGLGLVFVVALGLLVGFQLLYYFWGHAWQSPGWVLVGLSMGIVPTLARVAMPQPRKRP